MPKTISNQPKSMSFAKIKDDEINDLNLFDFYSFEIFLRKHKGHIYKNEDIFQSYKKGLLEWAKCEENCDPIEVIQEADGKYSIIDGKARGMAAKVLGIRPLVKIV